MDEFAGGAPLGPEGLAAAAAAADLTSVMLWTVISVETSGSGFLADRRPKILFERHIFHRFTGGRFDGSHPGVSNPVSGGYGAPGDNQYVRLAEALALDRTAALQSASWGMGQIMGENYAASGYAGVEEMVAAFVAAEDAQLLAMAKFVKAQNMDAYLRAQDWPSFARRYNGPDYAKNNYDGHLAHYHDLYATQGVPDLTIRTAQVWLTYKGFNPGGVDGRMGPQTAAAVRAFQSARGLPVTGAVDAALAAALAA